MRLSAKSPSGGGGTGGRANSNRDGVVCNLIAARGIAHQVDLHHVVAVSGQGAGKAVGVGRARSHEERLATSRRHDIEVVRRIVGLEADGHDLAGLGTQRVFVGVIALDPGLERGFAGAGLELHTLPLDVVGEGGRGQNGKERDDRCENSLHARSPWSLERLMVMTGAWCLSGVASVLLEEAAIDPASQGRLAPNRNPAPARTIVALAAQIAHDGAIPDPAHDVGIWWMGRS